jgi:rhamnopyranosyl-N-acetylglucosaminyl-diphospho-decaprenol beta-1,3/1,4-galactofuranosyltransferase
MPAIQEHADDQRVCAVVVTYQRPELLLHCIEALLGQTRRPDLVLVIDNASADETPGIVQERFGANSAVSYVRLEENVGGAGGFYVGMREAYKRGFGWLWLLDDDSIATPDALERLLAGLERAPHGRPLLVASQVRWRDERLHPMNRPWPRWRWPGELLLAAQRKLILIRAATFVSVLVRREALQRFGLPLAHFFIWSDDIEYTARVLRDNPGYLVPDSVVHHWTKQPHTSVTDSGGRFYFHVRNTVWSLRGSVWTPRERINNVRGFLRSLNEYLVVNHWSPSALTVIARGLKHGFSGPVR